MKKIVTLALGISVFFAAASSAIANPCAASNAPFGKQTRCIKKHHHHNHHRMHHGFRNRMYR